MPEILEIAKRDVAYYFTNTDDFQRESKDDTNYVNGDQWTAGASQDRGQRPKPVINDAPTYIRKVQDFYKTRESSIKVAAVDSGSDKSLANLFQGLINQILRDSMGNFILDDSFYSMLMSGMGFCYVDAEYENKHSFNQKLVIKGIKNAESVFLDMNTVKKDRHDMMFGGWLFTMDRDEYNEKYDDPSPTGFPNSNSDYLDATSNTVMLCRYYHKKRIKDTLISFVSPLTGELESVLKSELKGEKYNDLRTEWDIEDIYSHIKETGKILATRTVDRFEIKWYIMNNEDVLDEGDWVGEYIPLVPMLGPEYRLDGKTFWTSLIRWSKEPGRIKNYLLGNTIENLAIKPLAPYMTTPAKMEGHEEQWGDANNNPQPYLLYNNEDLGNGQTDTTPPIPIPAPDIPAGLVTASQMIDEDKRRTMGILDGAMGAQGNENSGKAIMARSDEALDNTNVFIEQRSFSTQLLGRILVDLIPKYYDTERVVRIIGEDGEADLKTINAIGEDGNILNVKDANLDIFIETGPSASSRRKETQEGMLAVANSLPEQFRVAMADHLVESTDFQGSRELAERFRKIMPQQIFVEQDEQTPEQLEAKIAQLEQADQQKTAVIDELTGMLQSEKIKVESNEKIAGIKARTDLQKEEIKAGSALRKQSMSDQTDIKESEIQAESRKEVELIKQSFNDLSGKLDIIIKQIL